MDKEGFYVKDIISCLDEPKPTIKDSLYAFPLLRDFTLEGASVMSPRQQKEYVKGQMTKFRDIRNYPVEISQKLAALRSSISTSMRYDPSSVGCYPRLTVI